jgi:hypothetical protein
MSLSFPVPLLPDFIRMAIALVARQRTLALISLILKRFRHPGQK